MKGKSYLLSFAKTKGSIAAVALAAVLMAANATVASAQNKATENNGTENTIEGVDKLFGIDPSSAICIIRKTKCSRIFKRSASFSKTKRNFSKLSPIPQKSQKNRPASPELYTFEGS